MHIWKKPRLAVRVPELSTQIFLEVGIDDAQQQAAITGKYQTLYEYWLGSNPDRKNRNEIGRTMSSFLPKCTFNPVKFALLADQLDYFKAAITAQEQLPKAKDRPKLYHLFTFACILGSRQIGEWLIEKLQMDLTSLQGEKKDNLFAYVACSKNWEWFKDLLVQADVDHIPGQSYALVGWYGYKKLKEIEVELNLIPSPDDLSARDTSLPSQQQRR